MSKVRIATLAELDLAKPGHALVANVDLVIVRWPDAAEVSVLYGRCLHRGALLSGMYPLRNGAHPNHAGFKNGVKSLPNYMKELGYRACLAGKDGIQRDSDLYKWEFKIEKTKEHVPGANEPQHDRHRKSHCRQCVPHQNHL